MSAPRTTVVNGSRTNRYDVYIGRPSRWGNPFREGPDGTRSEVISLYREWLLGQPELCRQAREELQGRVLACYCKPRSCHGDVLAAVADGLLTEQA